MLNSLAASPGGALRKLVAFPMPIDRGMAAGRTYRTVSILLAVILLVAVGLKLQVALDPTEGGASQASPTTMAAIVVEWLLAAWLLIGVAREWSRRVTMLLLSVFVCVAASRLFAGHHDCGCFGRLKVHPGWTVALDVTALVVIWATGRPSPRAAHRSEIPPAVASRSVPRLPAWALTAGISLSLPVLTLLASGHAFGGVAGRSDFVLLEPQTWNGRRLPLLEYVKDDNARQRLSTGRWTLLVIDRHCDSCRQELKRVSSAPADGGSGGPSVCVIDVARRDSDQGLAGLHGSLYWVNLREDLHYLVKVPLEVSVNDGIVDGLWWPVK